RQNCYQIHAALGGGSNFPYVVAKAGPAQRLNCAIFFPRMVLTRPSGVRSIFSVASKEVAQASKTMDIMYSTAQLFSSHDPHTREKHPDNVLIAKGLWRSRLARIEFFWSGRRAREILEFSER